MFPGPRFYYRSLDYDPNNILSLEEVEAFYYSTPYFFEGEKAKVFTPSLLTSGTQNLQAHLKNLGYQGARAFSEIVDQNPLSGATDVKVSIDPGPQSLLRSIVVQGPGDTPTADAYSDYLGKPYNTFLRQDIVQDIRNHFYALGYADVVTEFSKHTTPATSNEIDVELTVVVKPGKQYTISDIHFEGAPSIQRSLLRKKLTVKEGDYLDPTNLAKSRLNLSRLGLFHKIDFELEDSEENQKSLTFYLQDRTLWELDTVVGWGSYERLRLGLMAEKLNAFGRDHRLQFRSVISTKSLLAESRYLIPHFLETSFPLGTKLFYLEREEISFDREEFGINVGTSRYLEKLDLNVDAVYSFESLDARLNDLGGSTGTPDSVRSGSVELRFSRDKRDNPLNPQSGYRFYGHFQWASEVLGGEVDYQSAAELGLSYHKEIKRGLIWHGSLSHAAVGSLLQTPVTDSNQRTFVSRRRKLDSRIPARRSGTARCGK